MSFFERIRKRATEANSLLCVGLDPHAADLPSSGAEAARDHCFRLIDATQDIAAAYKPNSAFFEVYGAAGISALRQVISHVPASIPVILDAKRGDIASTAEAYAQAVFKELGAWAVTINPYLGQDALQPFLADPERGVFLLCKTSNPGASDLQDLPIVDQTADLRMKGAQYLYERVALLAQEWNKNDNLGLVVGATQVEALRRVRQLTPDLWILAPGVGVQGGDLPAALEAGLRSDGMGLLITISRGISRSDDPHQVAERIRQMINEQREEFLSMPSRRTGQVTVPAAPDVEQLADGLLQADCIKFGQFTLKSGMVSPIYIDLRLLVAYPRLLEQVAKAYIPILKQLSFDRLAGLPYAALPIVTAISLQGGWPFIFPRKEVKSYGTKAEIEGLYHPGEQIVIIDDLATTGSSKFESIEKLASAGLKVKDIVVLIDRQSGAAQALEKAGYKLHSVVRLTQFLDYFETSGKVSVGLVKAARDFIFSSG